MLSGLQNEAVLVFRFVLPDRNIKIQIPNCMFLLPRAGYEVCNRRHTFLAAGCPGD
jgi:hypothetical protein